MKIWREWAEIKNIKKYLVVINFLITFAIITPDEGEDLSFKIHKI